MPFGCTCSKRQHWVKAAAVACMARQRELRAAFAGAAPAAPAAPPPPPAPPPPSPPPPPPPPPLPPPPRRPPTPPVDFVEPPIAEVDIKDNEFVADLQLEDIDAPLPRFAVDSACVVANASTRWFPFSSAAQALVFASTAFSSPTDQQRQLTHWAMQNLCDILQSMGFGNAAAALGIGTSLRQQNRVANRIPLPPLTEYTITYTPTSAPDAATRMVTSHFVGLDTIARRRLVNPMTSKRLLLRPADRSCVGSGEADARSFFRVSDFYRQPLLYRTACAAARVTLATLPNPSAPLTAPIPLTIRLGDIIQYQPLQPPLRIGGKRKRSPPQPPPPVYAAVREICLTLTPSPLQHDRQATSDLTQVETLVVEDLQYDADLNQLTRPVQSPDDVLQRIPMERVRCAVMTRTATDEECQTASEAQQPQWRDGQVFAFAEELNAHGRDTVLYFRMCVDAISAAELTSQSILVVTAQCLHYRNGRQLNELSTFDIVSVGPVNAPHASVLAPIFESIRAIPAGLPMFRALPTNPSGDPFAIGAVVQLVTPRVACISADLPQAQELAGVGSNMHYRQCSKCTGCRDPPATGAANSTPSTAQERFSNPSFDASHHRRTSASTALLIEWCNDAGASAAELVARRTRCGVRTSAGLEPNRWFGMLRGVVNPITQLTIDSDHLFDYGLTPYVIERLVNGCGGKDTVKAKAVNVVLRGVARPDDWTDANPPYNLGSAMSTHSAMWLMRQFRMVLLVALRAVHTREGQSPHTKYTDDADYMLLQTLVALSLLYHSPTAEQANLETVCQEFTTRIHKADARAFDRPNTHALSELCTTKPVFGPQIGRTQNSELFQSIVRHALRHTNHQPTTLHTQILGQLLRRRAVHDMAEGMRWGDALEFVASEATQNLCCSAIAKCTSTSAKKTASRNAVDVNSNDLLREQAQWTAGEGVGLLRTTTNGAFTSDALHHKSHNSGMTLTEELELYAEVKVSVTAQLRSLTDLVSGDVLRAGVSDAVFVEVHAVSTGKRVLARVDHLLRYRETATGNEAVVLATTKVLFVDELHNDTEHLIPELSTPRAMEVPRDEGDPVFRFFDISLLRGKVWCPHACEMTCHDCTCDSPLYQCAHFRASPRCCIRAYCPMCASQSPLPDNGVCDRYLPSVGGSGSVNGRHCGYNRHARNAKDPVLALWHDAGVKFHWVLARGHGYYRTGTSA